MKFILLAIVLALAAADNWVVLAAGSEGFGNYRHQADIAHAYQIVKRGGIKEDHIITMMYNDVATAAQNPFPGELYNQPGDDPQEVYKGVKVDYEGNTVSGENFMKVLTGDETAGGPVLKSTSEDNIFVNFSDHGGSGLLAFPGGYLYEKDLTAGLLKMHEKKMYKKLVIYVEACYAGSMFLNLPSDISIVAFTAAHDKESSWGWYCGSEAVVKGKNVGSCLGDEFSVRWMEDTDVGKQDTETLEDQFNFLVTAVTKSHVTLYGDKSFQKDTIGEYLGNGGPAKSTPKSSVSWDSRDNNYHYLRYMYEISTGKDKEMYHKLFLEELSMRQQIDRYFNSFAKTDDLYLYEGTIQNWDCYDRAIQQFTALFGMSDYGLKYFDVYANMCRNNANAF